MPNLNSDTVCPSCEAHGLSVFYDVKGVPTNSCILLDSAEEAQTCRLGDLRLAFCDNCGFIFNQAFEIAKTEYDGRYEETQSYSPTFNAFHENLAKRLIEKYNLQEKDVVEIGCGKGEFLMLMAELGDNRGLGIDPGTHVERIKPEVADKLDFITDFYAEEHLDRPVDFLVCKMTLEHISQPLSFLRSIRRGMEGKDNAVIFFQVPEAVRILNDCAFEDIYYEHCSYFTPDSLSALFRRAGFDVIGTTVEYDDQYLTIEATIGQMPEGEPAEDRQYVNELKKLVADFSAKMDSVRDEWQARLAEAQAQGKTVALWGSGSKAVSFLTTLGVGDKVDFVIDINPNRHGHYMPVTAQRIAGPDELPALKPDMIIIMNRIYENEICASLNDLGLEPDIHAL